MSDLQKKLSQKEFQAMLDKPPAMIARHPKYNFEYLPISYAQRTMDKIFGAGCWTQTSINYQVSDIGLTKPRYENGKISGESVAPYEQAIVSIQYTHPVTGLLMSCSGIAANTVSINKVTMGASALAAEAFKNAIKPLGKVFGRDLNRDKKAPSSEAKKWYDANPNFKKEDLIKGGWDGETIFHVSDTDLRPYIETEKGFVFLTLEQEKNWRKTIKATA